MEFSADQLVLYTYATNTSGFFTPATPDINENFQINENIMSFTMFLELLFC
jgi:hypothetical protein